MAYSLPLSAPLQGEGSAPEKQEPNPLDVFEGEGVVAGSARKGNDPDDEFDYVFSGGQREGATHKQVFKPKAVPAHLVTNVRQQPLTAVGENEEEEEEDEEEAEDASEDATASEEQTASGQETWPSATTSTSHTAMLAGATAIPSSATLSAQQPAKPSNNKLSLTPAPDPKATPATPPAAPAPPHEPAIPPALAELLREHEGISVPGAPYRTAGPISSLALPGGNLIDECVVDILSSSQMDLPFNEPTIMDTDSMSTMAPSDYSHDPVAALLAERRRLSETMQRALIEASPISMNYDQDGTPLATSRNTMEQFMMKSQSDTPRLLTEDFAPGTPEDPDEDPREDADQVTLEFGEDVPQQRLVEMFGQGGLVTAFGSQNGQHQVTHAKSSVENTSDLPSMQLLRAISREVVSVASVGSTPGHGHASASMSSNAFALDPMVVASTASPQPGLSADSITVSSMWHARHFGSGDGPAGHILALRDQISTLEPVVQRGLRAPTTWDTVPQGSHRPSLIAGSGSLDFAPPASLSIRNSPALWPPAAMQASAMAAAAPKPGAPPQMSLRTNMNITPTISGQAAAALHSGLHSGGTPAGCVSMATLSSGLHGPASASTASNPSSSSGATLKPSLVCASVAGAVAGGAFIKGKPPTRLGTGVVTTATQAQTQQGTDEWEMANRQVEQAMKQSNVDKTSSQGTVTPKTWCRVPYTDLQGRALHVKYTGDQQDAARKLMPDPGKQTGFFARLFCSTPKPLPPALHAQAVNVLCMAKVAYSDTDPLHWDLLTSSFAAFTGQSSAPSRHGKHWASLGWQGDDPATDLRGCGVFGLLQLCSLHDLNPSNGVTMYRLSRDPVQEYPLAIVSLNMTKYTLQALREGRLNSAVIESSNVWSVVAAFHAGAMATFHKLWKESHSTMVQSGFIMKEVEGQCRQNAKALLKAGLAPLS